MNVTITECPRDAMQGIDKHIPTPLKITYINALLECNFDVLDCGSFVSPKVIPQLADTKDVLEALNPSPNTRLLVIVANTRGAKEACRFEKIHYLGFPFSVSEEFQKRNTNQGREGAFGILKEIQSLARSEGKETVAYISMGFGNPYGEAWSVDLVKKWAERIIGLGIKNISLSDTTGTATPDSVSTLFSQLIPAFPSVKFGAHFHTRPDNWRENIEAAYEAGCTSFDGALKGFGGCPMAQDSLTGNLPTENLLQFLEERGEKIRVDKEKLSKAMALAGVVFG